MAASAFSECGYGSCGRGAPPFAYFCAFKPSCIVPVAAFPAQSVETDITSEEFERDRFGVLISKHGYLFSASGSDNKERV